MRTVLAAFTLALLSTSAFAASPDAILAANRAASGGAALAGKAAVVLEFGYVGNGLTGSAAGTTDLADGRFEQDFVVGPAKGANGYDGVHVWAKDNAGIVTLQEGGDAVPLAVNNAYRNANLWWRPDHGGAAIADDGRKTDGGAAYDVLTVTPKGGKPFDAWFDAKTHLLFRTVEAQANVTVTTTTTNYRAFDGVQAPVDTLVSTGGDAKYDQHLTLTRAAFLAKSDPAVYAPPQSAAADFAIAGGAHAVTFPFQLIANHIHANVMVDGKGPYLFIFDTGGVNIVTPDLARSLGLKVEGHAEGRGAGSGTIDMSMTHVDKLDVGGAVVNNQLFISFDLDAMYPANGTHMAGMVGYEVFRRFVTTIDYGAKTITLTDPKFFDPKDAGTPVHIAFNGNAAIVEGSYDGIPGKFQIDTGSRSALTLDAPFVAANHVGADAAKAVDAVDGWGVGGPSRSHVIRGGALKIGDAVTVDHPVVGLGTDTGGAFADPTLAGNIGGGVLKRFVVTFDYGHNTMYLRPTAAPVDDLDTYDRAGTWFNIEGANYKVISVTKGGPADQAGLKEGDVIAAVDGKPAATLDLPALRQRLRDEAPGTVVTFAVLRDGKPTDLKVTLRDQI
ncbi:MAG: aspartyl protease family protein [Rhizomicrobium sp.]